MVLLSSFDKLCNHSVTGSLPAVVRQNTTILSAGRQVRFEVNSESWNEICMAADQRGLSVAQLGQLLVEVAVRQRLVDAVIDAKPAKPLRLAPAPQNEPAAVGRRCVFPGRLLHTLQLNGNCWIHSEAEVRLLTIGEHHARDSDWTEPPQRLSRPPRLWVRR